MLWSKEVRQELLEKNPNMGKIIYLFIEFCHAILKS